MDQIGLFFKCQSCSDYVLTCNIQCPNGHQVCQPCFENLSNCPTCHQRVAISTRIPFLLTANVDPILNCGDSFDLLLPSLLRVAPALHPCSQNEMICCGPTSEDTVDQLNNLMIMSTTMNNTTNTTNPTNNKNNAITTDNINNVETTCNDTENKDNQTETLMQINNNLADQLLANSNKDVEETLSRLMMLASMSPGPANAPSPSSSNDQYPPTNLV